MQALVIVCASVLTCSQQVSFHGLIDQKAPAIAKLLNVRGNKHMNNQLFHTHTIFIPFAIVFFKAMLYSNYTQILVQYVTPSWG